MSTFSLDVAQEPLHLTISGIAAGYGVLSVPIDGLLPGDVVDAVSLVVIDASGSAIVSATLDQVQRAQGYYEWVTAASVAAHFTLDGADVAAIAASAGAASYQVTALVVRSGNSYDREIQDGTMTARAAFPSPPLIVATITVSGGPIIGAATETDTLSAICYNGQGAPLPDIVVVWSSSNPAVATVDSAGVVTLVAPGECSIIASAQGVTSPETLAMCVTSLPLGALLYGDGTGGVTVLPAGTDGYVLTLSAGVPTWAPGGGGGATLTFGANLTGTSYNGSVPKTIAVAANPTFSGLITGQAGLTITSGATSLQSVTATTGHYTGAVQLDGVLTLGAVPAQPNNSPLISIGSNAAPAIMLSGYGSTSGGVYGATRALGTYASPLPVIAGSDLIQLRGGGFDGAAYHFTGSAVASATETWTSTTWGSQWTWITVNTGTTTAALMTFGADGHGGLVVPGSVTGTSLVGPLANSLTFGTHLSGGSYNNAGAVTLTTDAVSTATPSTLVARDSGGNAAFGNALAPAISGTTTVVSISAVGAGAVPSFQLSTFGAGGIGRLIFSNAGGTDTAPTASPSGAGLAQMLGFGHDGVTYHSGVNMLALTTETWTTSARGTSFALSVFKTGTLLPAVTTYSVDGLGGWVFPATGSFVGTVTAPTFSGALAGNASTATKLATPRNINGVAFDGTADITVTAAAGTLTGTTLAATVVTSSLTTVGTLAAPHVTSLTVDSGGITVTSGATLLQAVSATTGTYTGLVQTTASVVGGAGLNLPHGTAPTSPVNGDLWTTTAGAFFRINGVTQQLVPTTVTSLASLTSAASLATVGTITSGVWNGTVITGTYGGTGINNGASTITIGGSVTFSGAFTFAGTVTGNTAVTFPTTGTLVNTAVTTLSSLATVGVLASPHVTTLTVDSGGITVTSGTSAFQAITGTTIVLTSTFTGRIKPRTGTVTSSATPAINTDNVDYYSITALATAITGFTMTGTPNVGDVLIISVTDNGTPRALTFGSSFENSGTQTLPTTTVASTRMVLGFIWNDVTTKWTFTGLA